MGERGKPGIPWYDRLSLAEEEALNIARFLMIETHLACRFWPSRRTFLIRQHLQLLRSLRRVFPALSGIINVVFENQGEKNEMFDLH